MKNGRDAVLQRVSDWGLVERVDDGRVTENDREEDGLLANGEWCTFRPGG